MLASPHYTVLMVTMTSNRVIPARIPILQILNPSPTSLAASAFQHFLLSAVHPTTADRGTGSFLVYTRFTVWSNVRRPST